MAAEISRSPPMSVFARWRPLNESEASGEITHEATTTTSSNSLLSISISQPAASSKDKPWKSSPAFSAVLGPGDDNAKSYATVVAPAIPRLLEGGSCSFFAYGHSGSGKTHTIIGYDYENDKQLGLCLTAARQLFDTLHALNADAGTRLGIGLSLFELRKNSAFDLLNNRTECHIREGPDGKTHIRGRTEMLEGGKVRVQPIVQRPCWDFDSLRGELIRALGRRAVGNSSVHDQSSRTHAVLELEVVNQELVDARQVVVGRQSELVPVGKRATDIFLEESMKSLILKPGGRYEANSDYQQDQARIDAAEAEKAECEARVAAAEEHVASIRKASPHPCLGAKMVFVDLAGAEYHQEKGTGGVQMPKQTPQERQEGRQINTDLLALKEVIRAWAKKQQRIPFRSSPLTMVLREHFLNSRQDGASMVVTVSLARAQYAATLNSLKYGSLVGAATA